MTSYTARYTPGDDKSPMAPAIEMIEACVARKHAASGQITEKDAATIANLAIASIVTCGSAGAVLSVGAEVDRVTMIKLLEQLSTNLVSIAKLAGLDEATYYAASIRMYRDAHDAGRAAQ